MRVRLPLHQGPFSIALALTHRLLSAAAAKWGSLARLQIRLSGIENLQLESSFNN